MSFVGLAAPGRNRSQPGCVRKVVPPGTDLKVAHLGRSGGRSIRRAAMGQQRTSLGSYAPVPAVTSPGPGRGYLLITEAMTLRPRGARPMTKFYALIAACAVFAPMAFATLSRASQIVA